VRRIWAAAPFPFAAQAALLSRQGDVLQAFRADGADGLISRKRGRPSNRALGSVFRETVLAIVRERYADFGPTLAAEKLSELHGLDLGVETLRQWMIGAGIWVRRKDRLKRVHR
jgi:hypothetical protein